MVILTIAKKDSFMKKIFIGRQPILNTKEELIAYEVLFRDTKANFCDVDNSFATASVIANTVYNFGIDNILDNKKGFINFNYEMIMNDKMIDILPPQNIVIEILETMKIDKAVVNKCKDLKQKGYLLAVDDFIGDEEHYKEILNIIDIVKVDLIGVKDLKSTTEKLKKYNVELLAEKVETKEEFELCKKLGYSYFQGYFFAKPTIIEGKKIDASYHSLIKLVEILERDADIKHIVDIFKEESGLSYQLLYVLNNTVSAVKKEITSIQQAISMLGISNVRKWVMLLLYMQDSEDKANCKCNPICQMALKRAKMMEVFEKHRKNSTKVTIEEAFVTGLLSLLDVLLGVRKDEIFSEISVSGDIKYSILNCDGKYSDILSLVISMEKRDYDKALTYLSKLNIDNSIFNNYLF